MKHINEKSKKILETLISKMEDGYAKIDNSKGSFMPVSIFNFKRVYQYKY